MLDRTSDFKDAVRRRRELMGIPKPASEILPKPGPRTAFAMEARLALQAVYSTAVQF